MRALAFLSVVWCLLPGAALAQATRTFPTDEFSASTFYPAPGMGDYLMVDGAVVSGWATPHFGATFDYAHEPLDVITQCEDRDEIDCATVGDRVAVAGTIATLSLTAAITLADRIQLGAVLPLAYASGDGIPILTSTGPINDVRGGSSMGVGDPRLRIEAQLVGGRREGLAMSVVAWGSAPLGQATAPGRYLGDDGPGAGGHLAFELFFGERARVALNVGGLYRPVRGIIAHEVGPMLSYAGAFEWDLSSTAGVLAELTGTTGFDPPTRTDQVEARLAGLIRVGDFAFHVGAGAGIVYGPGVPGFRFLLGGRWAGLPAADTDGDGVLDEIDACPTDEEDQDGFLDEDGCPERDNDDDGILDADDRCPDEAEDLDEYEDEDGCPEPDNDGDGIRDGYDSCPQTPEDMDGDRDDDGCPDADRDGDGVQDSNDGCPDEAEDTDGLGDEDGCPETDFDEDGVPDERDECPESPEDRDGFQDRDGCPEQGGRIRASPDAPAPAQDE